MGTIIIETNSQQETREVGFKMGRDAAAGQIICLTGDLGVGKTVFTQGFADGLEIREPICSPTFTIIQEYTDGRLPLYHFDVYRLGSIEEMDEIFLRRRRVPRGVGQPVPGAVSRQHDFCYHRKRLGKRAGLP
jgi:tRNA threonylcarbamoyl adenosine modification protein YjeE